MLDKPGAAAAALDRLSLEVFWGHTSEQTSPTMPSALEAV